MPTPWRIGIVGCGVAGLTAAASLALQGHLVTLLERAPILTPVGAGLLLQPSGQLALQHLGLLDRVIANAEPISGLHAYTHQRKTLVHLAYERLDPTLHGYGVHRDDLFQVLYQYAASAGVQFQLGITLVSSRQTATEIIAIDETARELGPFDVLIAADGARSRLRTAHGLGASVHEFPLGAAWFSGHSNAVRGQLLQVTRGGKQLIGLLPLGLGRCSFFCALPPGGKKTLQQRGLASLKAEVLSLCPESASLLDQLHSLDDLAYTRYQIVNLRQWNTGRLLCIGDAAHSTTPHLGQGVNLALLDALCVANEFHRAVTTHACPMTALARSATFRKEQVTWCWRLSNLLGPTFQNQDWFLSAARDKVLPWLPRLPFIGKLMVGTMAGLKTGLFSRLKIDGTQDRTTSQ